MLLGVLAYWQVDAGAAGHRRARSAARVTRFGVPHHGVLLVNAIQGLVYFPMYWYQMVKVIELGMQRELIIFGIANLLGSTAGASWACRSSAGSSGPSSLPIPIKGWRGKIP